MSSLLRNLPVILLAVAVAACVYFLYQNINNVSDRLDQISHELYYSINSVNDLTSRLGELGIVKDEVKQNAGAETVQTAEEPQQTVHQEPPTGFPTVTELVEGQSFGDESDAESVKSGEVQFVPNEPHNDEPPREEEFKEILMPASSKRNQSSESVQDYIGNLENFVKKTDDTESVTSGVSSASALQTRKKVPPYPAKSFSIGHKEQYQGKVYECIQTRGGAIRWGRAQPLSALNNETTKEEEVTDT